MMLTARQPPTSGAGFRTYISILLLMSMSAGFSDGIACYHCASQLHETCGHGFTAEQMNSSTISADEYNKCATETTLNITSGITVVVRGIPTHPLISNQSDGCYTNARTEDKASRYCICSTDLCNAEPPPDTNGCNQSATSTTQLIFGILTVAVFAETARRIFV